jgi:hypothetical protein
MMAISTKVVEEPPFWTNSPIKPDILLVAMGVPRQEFWISRK